MTNKTERISKLKKMIAELPAGSISRKTINGKVYFYHQWQENGKTQGYSVSEEEAAEIKIQIERRRALQKELRALENLYREKFGCELAHFYRPPEGKFDRKSLCIAKKLGYHTAFWSLAYADWDNEKQPEPEKSKQLLLANTHNGAVILLHPTSKTNADILDAIITELKAQGYEFGTLDELYASVCK